MCIDKAVIITCFSYPGINRWALRDEYLLSDLERVIRYCINNMGCCESSVYILTDINIEKCFQALKGIQPNIERVRGARSYEYLLMDALKEIGKKKLFFYYTGHGGDRYLMVPNGSEVENYRGIVRIFENCSSEEIVGVFDCCYAESIINSIRWEGEKKVILVGSSSSYQTCGFFYSDEDKGSLFTYYFFEYLRSNPCRMLKNLILIEEKILQYRMSLYKPKQNITLVVSGNHSDCRKCNHRYFPEWLMTPSS